MNAEHTVECAWRCGTNSDNSASTGIKFRYNRLFIRAFPSNRDGQWLVPWKGLEDQP